MINSTINASPDDLRPYPKLRFWPDHPHTIIMMSAEKIGMVVSVDAADAIHQIGEYRDSWTASMLEDFVGTVTIKNG